MVTAPSVTTLLLILASGARYRIGIAGRGNDAAFNVTVPADTARDAHMVDRLAALARAFDVELEPIRDARAGPHDHGRRARRGPNASGADRPARRACWSTSRPARRSDSGRTTATSPSFATFASGARARSFGSSRRRPSAARGAKSRAAGGGSVRRDAAASRRHRARRDGRFRVHARHEHRARGVGAQAARGRDLRARARRRDWALYGTRGRSIEHTEPDLRTSARAGGRAVDQCCEAMESRR